MEAGTALALGLKSAIFFPYIVAFGPNPPLFSPSWSLCNYVLIWLTLLNLPLKVFL